MLRAWASQYFPVPAIADDKLNGSQPHCAQSMSASYREDDLDPIEGLADIYTTPNHLIVPTFADYYCTLVK